VETIVATIRRSPRGTLGRASGAWNQEPLWEAGGEPQRAAYNAKRSMFTSGRDGEAGLVVR